MQYLFVRTKSEETNAKSPHFWRETDLMKQKETLLIHFKQRI